MNPDDIREKFELYRKWFKTLLVKEFLNLPARHQERFIAIADKFLKDCRRIHEEGKDIKEKTVKIVVKKVVPPDNQKEEYEVQGTVEGSQRQVTMMLPTTRPVPEPGSRLNHILFSMDEDMWYSSKEELVTGRRS